MRRAALVRTLAAVLFVGFAATAYLDPQLFAGAHARSSHGALWLVVGLLAAGCAAKLTVPVKAFGLTSYLSAPLFVPLAAPYFLRLLWLDAGARVVARMMSPRPAASAPPSVRPPRPYALPSRVATALVAAARARK